MSSSAATPELPKQYDHAAAQSRWYPFWLRQGYFHGEPDRARQPFSMVIPPPNVTGALHLGHALNNTLQDILIRWKRMQGYNVLWMPGTDHAGIATQAVVERRLLEEEKLTRHDLGRQKLVERIWTWKQDYEARILTQLQQMGCSCDWARTRFTFDEVCARAVRHTFFRMFAAGKIYRGKRLVNWDTFLQTAVSDDELFHETVPGKFWHFRYPLIDPAPGEPTHVTIATTRPETMLGDTAVAVHPHPAAALDKVAAELRAKLAAAPEKEKAAIEDQLANIARRRTDLLPLLVKLAEMAAAGKQVLLPLLNRPIPLVADIWAKPELGTGCVKITPAHDANDYEVGQRQKLPAINIMNPDGTLNAAAGPYEGLVMSTTARKRVVADMEAAGLLEKVEDREIELAHSDRSKTPSEPYLAEQWFVKMGDDDGTPGLAQMAMDAVSDGRVQIVPPRYAKSYLDWLGEKRDWCIGRQLWWGHRVPVWHAKCPESVLRHAFAGRDDVTWRETNIPGEWHVGALQDLPPDALNAAALAENIHLIKPLEQDPDVLDTWFSSALWPHSTFGWPEQTPELGYYYPTSVLSTSRDIITLWVARMVLTGLFNLGEVPFRQVYIHPKILDAFGETMSKSKGNGVDPADVIAKFGADALRFGLAYLTTETQDIRMPVEFECPHCQATIEQTKSNRTQPRIACKKCGQAFGTQWASKPEDTALPRGAVVSERFELGRNFCNKLWNAARFAILNLAEYTPGPVADDELAIEDRWLLSRLATVTEVATTCLAEFRFADAARELYDFAWNEFCSFYVEMAKPRLADAAGRPAAQRVLVHVLDALVRLLHPIVPFITEEIWQLLAQHAPERGLPMPQRAAASVMIAPWPAADKQRQDRAIEERFALFQKALAGLREVRARQNVPPSATIRFAIDGDPAGSSLLRPMAPYFRSMAAAECVGRVAAASTEFSLAGTTIKVDLAGAIDVAAEIARKQKELESLAGRIAGKQRQLANENFVGRAKPEIVEKERAALAELQQQQAATAAALAALEASRSR